MRGILLVSHGELAKGMKNSIEMITGTQDKVRYVGIESNEDVGKFEERIDMEVKKLGEVEKIIIFCDLLGGTPCNIAFKKYYKNSKYSIISGMNSAMILSAIVKEEIDSKNIISDGVQGIVDLSDINLIDCEEE